MRDLPDPWAQYAALQKRLQRASRVDSNVWGTEAALNCILEAQTNCTGITADEVERTRDTSARRERARRAWRKRHAAEITEPIHDKFAVIETGDFLLRVQQALRPDEWALLLAFVDATDQQEVGTATTSRVRVKIFRLRQRLRTLFGRSDRMGRRRVAVTPIMRKQRIPFSTSDSPVEAAR